jgi:hypothetical protein
MIFPKSLPQEPFYAPFELFRGKSTQVLFLQCNSERSRNSKKIFAAKERKERIDKDLCCFLSAIFAIFCGNSFWLRLAALGLLSFFVANGSSLFSGECRPPLGLFSSAISATLRESKIPTNPLSEPSPMKANEG